MIELIKVLELLWYLDSLLRNDFLGKSNYFQIASLDIQTYRAVTYLFYFLIKVSTILHYDLLNFLNVETLGKSWVEKPNIKYYECFQNQVNLL